MKTLMTKEEYVAFRRTKWDKVLFYSWIPFMVIFFLMMIAAYNEQMEGAKLLAFLEVPALLLVVVCRAIILANREKNYIKEYYDMQNVAPK